MICHGIHGKRRQVFATKSAKAMHGKTQDFPDIVFEAQIAFVGVFRVFRGQEF
jgi:hypothetical protein